MPPDNASRSLQHSPTRRLDSTHPRRGWTLLESLVVISMLGLLLGVVGPLSAVILRLHRHVQMDARLYRSLVRLSDQMRRDVRMSTEAQVAANQDAAQDGYAELRLSQPPNMVHYDASEDGLDRMVLRADQPVARDHFSLPSQSRACWSIVDRTGRRFVRLQLSLPWFAGESDRGVRQIELMSQLGTGLTHPQTRFTGD